MTRHFPSQAFTAFMVIIAAAFAAVQSYAAEPPAYDEERVMITAGDVVLGASVFRPKGASGDLPAIVTAHGSAATTRTGVGFYTNRALEMGFVVLSFDKRGTGESTGAYEAFNVADSPRVFQNLAMDVVWSVRWLAAQKGVDESRIGLFGGSQAGWIMPLAAAQEPLIKFIVIGEGVPVTAGEENAHGTYIDERAGSEENASAQLVAAADAVLESYAGDAGYDPAPILDATDIPVLWIFGLRDAVIPVTPSLARLEALIQAGKTSNDIYIFPFGDHNFTNRATGERYDVKGVVEPWLQKHGFLEESR